MHDTTAAPMRGIDPAAGAGALVVRPEEGPVHWQAGGDRHALRIPGERTGGAFALMEIFVVPGGGPPPHVHAREDEMFFVVKGSITIRLRDGDVRLGEGEFVIIPRGVEHKPVADEEAHVLLFEPKTVLNTGDVTNELTRPELERV